MSAEDFIPNTDTALPPYLNNLTTYANANLTQLGLVAADITPISTGATTYQTALNNVQTAKDALKQAVLAKDAARKSVVNNVRILARKVQGNPAVSPAQKAALGFSPRTGQRTTPKVYAPADLLVIPNANGTNTLKWKSAGNVPGTIYVIEASYGSGGTWDYVNAVNKTRFEHTGQTPGALVFYRVSAQRADKKSKTCPPASVYCPASTIETVLQLAA